MEDNDTFLCHQCYKEDGSDESTFKESFDSIQSRTDSDESPKGLEQIGLKGAENVEFIAKQSNKRHSGEEDVQESAAEDVDFPLAEKIEKESTMQEDYDDVEKLYQLYIKYKDK